VLRYAWEHGVALPGLPSIADFRDLDAQIDELDAERARLKTRKRELEQQRSRSAAAQAVDADTLKCDDTGEAELILEREWAAYHERRRALRIPQKEQARQRARHSKLSLLIAACRRIETDADLTGRPISALELYFPYQLDYRGRAYSMVENLNPQGNDHARALLEFAEGKALDERGKFWLDVYLANTFGYDKAPLADRAAWAERNGDLIRELASMVDVDGTPLPDRIIGLSPEARSFWQQADRKTPWQFLAASIEWVRSNDPGFVSHMPVALDASASGLQHLSALLRDEAGAYATNLTRAETPQDIYGRVASRLRSVVETAAAAGNAHALEWKKTGTVDRKAVKRGVKMTPYGVTDRGLKDQLREYIEESGAQFEDTAGAIRYLAEELKRCIDLEVPSAHLVMDWLRDVADLCAKHGCGLAWTTPAGFPVVVEHHHYHDGEPIRIRWTDPSGKRREYRLINRVPQDLLGVDAVEQRRTITPNFVHALDAAHLMLSVARLQDEGLRHFAVIHDSYGVHAVDIDQMLTGLRDEFAKMYGGSRLDEYIDEQIRRPGTPSGLREQLCSLKEQRPTMGTFDVAQVRDATYMFS
jgi:DNA-directed RNA polymerase